MPYMASMAPVFTSTTAAAAWGAEPFRLMPSTIPATLSWSPELMVGMTLPVVVRFVSSSASVRAVRVCDGRKLL